VLEALVRSKPGLPDRPPPPGLDSRKIGRISTYRKIVPGPNTLPPPYISVHPYPRGGSSSKNGLVSSADVLLGYWRVGAGASESHVSTFQIVLATVLPTVAVILATVFLWLAARRRQTGVVAPLPPTTPADPTTLDSLMQSMSQRLAAAEGRMGVIAAELQAVAILNQRVSAIEANMPNLQEAMEKYSDSVNRADKRATERARVETKTQGFQTAGEAAGLLGAAGAGGEPALTQPVAPTNNRRAGLLGSGGRNRR